MRRRAVRGSLAEWSRVAGYEPARHHLLMISELEALERGETDRLMILGPPGMAKTTYASRLFTAWYLARHPSHLILSGSHTQSFASRKIGKQVRRLIEAHSNLLGVYVPDDSSAMEDWGCRPIVDPQRRAESGNFRAVGVGVAVAGERADLGLVEDPFARWEDAQRATVQEEVWDWYTGDFSPRLKPQARRVVIMTRFNEFDLAGRILERDARLGISWRVVRLPMIAEDDDPLGRVPGERLWSEWFTDQQVVEARADAQKWSAMYQQRPSPETGDYFRADWLKPYITPPDLNTLRIYGASDYATKTDAGDYTVHLVVGVDPEDRIYLLDVWRARRTSDVWVDTWCDLVSFWRPIGWAEERGQILGSVGPFLEKVAEERGAYVAREQFPSTADKAVRAQSIRGRMAQRGLYVPVNAPWYPDLKSELMSFPYGKHDDQVDALGLIGQVLDRMLRGKRAPSEGPKKVLAIGQESTVTLEDVFKEHERRYGRNGGAGGRI